MRYGLEGVGKARFKTVRRKWGEPEQMDSGITVQGPAKRWAPGCVNAAGKARQEW